MSESTPSASTDEAVTLLIQPSALSDGDPSISLTAGGITIRKTLKRDQVGRVALTLSHWYHDGTRIATDEEVAQDLTQEA